MDMITFRSDRGHHYPLISFVATPLIRFILPDASTYSATALIKVLFNKMRIHIHQ